MEKAASEPLIPEQLPRTVTSGSVFSSLLLEHERHRAAPLRCYAWNGIDRYPGLCAICRHHECQCTSGVQSILTGLASVPLHSSGAHLANADARDREST